MDKVQLLHLKNLVIIALCDGVLDPVEKEFILEKASLLGMAPKEVDQLFNEALSFKNKLIEIDIDRERQLADAVLMTVLDGYIHENEQKILRELGASLGFEEGYVEQIIQKSFELWKRST